MVFPAPDSAIDELTAINAQKAGKNAELVRHAQTQLSAIDTQQTILQAFSSLIDYLEGRITKTEVLNFPAHISTPDIVHVVHAIDSLKEALIAQQSPAAGETAEPAEPIDYTEQFGDLHSALKDAVAAIKAQKTTIEAPQVRLPAPQVHVDAPDMKPVSDGLQDVQAAVKAVKLGEVKGGAMGTRQVNSLITERYDEYRIVYDDMEDEPVPKATNYYYKGKKVASLHYTYNEDGNLTGAKRA